MRKGFLTCLILIILISFLQSPVKGFEQTPDAKLGLPCEYTPKEGSVEELYKDIIARLIDPYISKEIANYYGKPYMYN